VGDENGLEVVVTAVQHWEYTGNVLNMIAYEL
jgi:hypothetical protein